MTITQNSQDRQSLNFEILWNLQPCTWQSNGFNQFDHFQPFLQAAYSSIGGRRGFNALMFGTFLAPHRVCQKLIHYTDYSSIIADQKQWKKYLSATVCSSCRPFHFTFSGLCASWCACTLARNHFKASANAASIRAGPARNTKLIDGQIENDNNINIDINRSNISNI